MQLFIMLSVLEEESLLLFIIIEHSHDWPLQVLLIQAIVYHVVHTRGRIIIVAHYHRIFTRLATASLPYTSYCLTRCLH